MASASSSETYPLLECSHHHRHHHHHLPKEWVYSLSLSLSLPPSPLSNLTVAPMSSPTTYHLTHSLRHVDSSPGILPATSSQRGLMDDDCLPTVPLITTWSANTGVTTWGWILKASNPSTTQMVRCTIIAIYLPRIILLQPCTCTDYKKDCTNALLSYLVSMWMSVWVWWISSARLVFAGSGTM